MRLARLSIVAIPLLGLLGALAPSAAESANALPANWVLTGENSGSYSVGVENKTLQLSSEATGGFGTAMQMIDSVHYIGKSVRFSADVRSNGVEGWAGLWMRVDGSGGKVLAFDNMQSRPLKGTTDWKHYDVVLPVEPSATRIAFGILLSGNGKVWMKDLGFEPVAGSVTSTAQATSPLPAEPNLNLTP